MLNCFVTSPDASKLLKPTPPGEAKPAHLPSRFGLVFSLQAAAQVAAMGLEHGWAFGGFRPAIPIFDGVLGGRLECL